MKQDIENEFVAAAPSRAEQEMDKFDRLDQLVRSLLDRYTELQRQHEDVSTQLAERDEQIRELNQRRQDAGKRLDDVLARLDKLDEEMDRRSATPAAEKD